MSWPHHTSGGRSACRSWPDILPSRNRSRTAKLQVQLITGLAYLKNFLVLYTSNRGKYVVSICTRQARSPVHMNVREKEHHQ
jgi:hypothetical protein